MAYKVDRRGKWKLYTQTIPAGSRVLGVITRDTRGREGGALVCLQSGTYVQMNGGVIRTLHQGDVELALRTVRVKEA
jgi:hypothetical protein